MKKITPSERLKLKIAEVKFEQEIQEREVSASFESIVSGLNPASIAKSSLQELADDRDVQESATGAALKFGTRFLAFKVIGRFGGVFGAVAAAVVGNLSDHYVEKTTPKMLNAVGRLFTKKKRKKNPEPEDVEGVEEVATNI
ncbi:MAG: hypothetical protein WBG42_05020 [Cryomorphaceae bacterium]